MPLSPQAQTVISQPNGSARVLSRLAQSALANQAEPDPFAVAADQYPILANVPHIYSHSGSPYKLEFWPPNEAGTAINPRPASFPNDVGGVQIFDRNITPLDILGDVVSHHLVKTDPTLARYYQSFEASLTPDQHARLKEQYKYAKANEGEKRPYEEWYGASGLPAYFRGYAFRQWPASFNEHAYTPEQRSMFDEMMKFLQTSH